MDDRTKIALSAAELDKVLDKEWILTKLRITEKSYELFGLHAAALSEAFTADAGIFGVEIAGSFPKISKGENYRQLPYVMLDYPSVFGREHIFALRTMFWWGNFFSCTLLLKGHYRDRFVDIILSRLQASPEELFVCINESEWEHHFEPGNYISASVINADELRQKPFIKIALKFGLEQWNDMPRLLKEGCAKLIWLMKD